MSDSSTRDTLQLSSLTFGEVSLDLSPGADPLVAQLSRQGLTLECVSLWQLRIDAWNVLRVGGLLGPREQLLIPERMWKRMQDYLAPKAFQGWDLAQLRDKKPRPDAFPGEAGPSDPGPSDDSTDSNDTVDALSAYLQSRAAQEGEAL